MHNTVPCNSEYHLHLHEVNTFITVKIGWSLNKESVTFLILSFHILFPFSNWYRRKAGFFSVHAWLIKYRISDSKTAVIEPKLEAVFRRLLKKISLGSLSSELDLQVRYKCVGWWKPSKEKCVTHSWILPDLSFIKRKSLFIVSVYSYVCSHHLPPQIPDFLCFPWKIIMLQ